MILKKMKDIFETPLSSFALREVFYFFPENLSSQTSMHIQLSPSKTLFSRKSLEESTIKNPSSQSSTPISSRTVDLQENLIRAFYQNPFLYFEDLL